MNIKECWYISTVASVKGQINKFNISCHSKFFVVHFKKVYRRLMRWHKFKNANINVLSKNWRNDFKLFFSFNYTYYFFLVRKLRNSSKISPLSKKDRLIFFNLIYWKMRFNSNLIHNLFKFDIFVLKVLYLPWFWIMLIYWIFIVTLNLGCLQSISLSESINHIRITHWSR